MYKFSFHYLHRFFTLLFLLLCFQKVAAQDHFGLRSLLEHGNVWKSDQLQTRLFDRDTIALKKRIDSAKMFLFQSKLEEAKFIVSQTLTHSHNISYHTGIVASTCAWGGILFKSGQADSGLVKVHEALKWYQKHKKQTTASSLSFAYALLGEIYAEKGISDSSHFYFHKGLELAEHVLKDTASIVSANNNLAVYWMGILGWEKAASHLQKAQQHLNSVKDSAKFNNLALALYTNQIKLMAMYRHNTDSALYYANKLLQLADKDSFQHAVVTHLIGHTFMEVHNYEKAIEYFLKAYHMKKRLAYLSGLEVARYSLGVAYTQNKEYKKAEHFLLEALESHEQNSRKNRHYLDVLYMLHKVNRKLGNENKAIEYLDRAFFYKDTLYSDHADKNIKALETRYKVSEKDKEIAEQNLALLQKENTISRKNRTLLIACIGGVLLILLLFLIRRNYKISKRNLSDKMLMLEQQVELQKLTAMITGEEVERKRIAQEIHDGVGGMIAAIKMNLSAYANKDITQGEDASIIEIIEMVENTANEVRRTSHNLMPDVLNKNGLIDALNIYVDSISGDSGLDIFIQVNSVWPDLDKSFELSLYRILQEVILNTIKHAKASKLVIQFRCIESEIIIMTEDNGIGFNEQEAQLKNGIGIGNIYSRVHLHRGELEIESAPGRGAVFCFAFQLSDNSLPLS